MRASAQSTYLRYRYRSRAMNLSNGVTPRGSKSNEPAPATLRRNRRNTSNSRGRNVAIRARTMRALFAGGQFTSAGGAPSNRIARWDGSDWTPLTTGLEGTSASAVHTLTVFDDGNGRALYVGGVFDIAVGIVSAYWARWGCAPCVCDVDGNGVVELADLAILLGHFGGSGGPSDGDQNGDGSVDLADLALLLSAFGTTCAATP